MSKFLSTAVAVSALLMATPTLAQHVAGGGGWHGGMGPPRGAPPHAVGLALPPAGQRVGGFPHSDFHGGGYGHFPSSQQSRWAGGQWRHGYHNGAYGWWWCLDNAWYPFAAPTYPYPAYAASYDDADTGAGPPPPPPEDYWYRCGNPTGFYPYVTACPGGWQVIPAAPGDQGGPEAQGGPPSSQYSYYGR
jgi:hypothetical protein